MVSEFQGMFETVMLSSHLWSHRFFKKKKVKKKGKKNRNKNKSKTHKK